MRLLAYNTVSAARLSPAFKIDYNRGAYRCDALPV